MLVTNSHLKRLCGSTIRVTTYCKSPILNLNSQPCGLEVVDVPVYNWVTTCGPVYLSHRTLLTIRGVRVEIPWGPSHLQITRVDLCAFDVHPRQWSMTDHHQSIVLRKQRPSKIAKHTHIIPYILYLVGLSRLCPCLLASTRVLARFDDFM